MSDALLRVLGPPAYLSAALALAWSSAVRGALVREVESTDLVPIPWVGS